MVKLFGIIIFWLITFVACSCFIYAAALIIKVIIGGILNADFM